MLFWFSFVSFLFSSKRYCRFINLPTIHPLIYTQTFFYLLIFKYCFICLISRSVVCLQSYTLLILILSDNAIYMQKKDMNRTDRITRINWMHLGYTGYGIAHYYLSSVNLGSVKMCTIYNMTISNRIFYYCQFIQEETLQQILPLSVHFVYIKICFWQLCFKIYLATPCRHNLQSIYTSSFRYESVL